MLRTVTLNALISTWAVRTGAALSWLPSAPATVQRAVHEGLQFLREYTLTETYRFENAFFSGSGKTPTSMPFNFPSNFLQVCV